MTPLDDPWTPLWYAVGSPLDGNDPIHHFVFKIAALSDTVKRKRALGKDRMADPDAPRILALRVYTRSTSRYTPGHLVWRAGSDPLLELKPRGDLQESEEPMAAPSESEDKEADFVEVLPM